jgi:hypothetical protein
MKMAICFMVALMLAGSAGADPNRYVWRSFGGSNVSLQPLFAWWRFAAETTNQPLDISVVNADKLAAISNVWEHLPARPLPDWVRVTGMEGGITVVGDMWRVDAVIAPAPMMTKHDIIYLRNPPAKEIADFKQARAQYMALQNTQSSEVAALQSLASTDQTNAVTYPGTVTTRNGVVVARSGMAAANQNAATLATLSNNLQATNASQLADLGRYLASFPATNVYYLDHFAMRTGKQINGLDVYDLGGAAGLNY